MYKVIIVEDDKMVAAINRHYVEMNPSFCLAGIFFNGWDALQYLKKHIVDLVILDYYMPIMNGQEFLQELKKMEQRPNVIMVTAANEVDTVQRLLDFGVTDYLVKPFEYIRFEQALKRFIRKRNMWGESSISMSQDEVDRVLFSDEAKHDGRKQLQKGLQEHTLETIRLYMRENKEHSFTSEEIAAHIRLSRVTVRRYLNYLTDIHEIASSVDYQTGGRPSIKYQYLLRQQ